MYEYRIRFEDNKVKLVRLKRVRENYYILDVSVPPVDVTNMELTIGEIPFMWEDQDIRGAGW